jgi:hypothetical protein
MDTLIAELDLPKTKLSEAEQAKLNTQRQIQQDRLDDIKAQIEALENVLIWCFFLSFQIVFT